ncbi:hypothetical protein B296_00013606 [Ensete ventricosum]|uniref:Uncharacterized protein n=1 Tax=Ensete ventricosum TaxID=4639 RepID=A0A426Y9H8_ENSVE|nr:hypothetical protein B296_00013606 [Ensete ventricosum]
MAWWDRVASPMRRVWAGVATRVGIRKSGELDSSFPPCFAAGLLRLRQEVSTCEYEDVRVLWELLTESGRAGPPLPTAATRGMRRRGEGPPADGGDEGDETPGRGVARFGAGPLRLLPQALDSSHA